MIIIRILLFPISLLYGFITWLRNKLFDWRILPSKAFDHPLIGVGNLSTGGTGKTPHVEYLVKLLKKSYKVAVLSRGYKRRSKGFQVASKQSTVREIGDEPLQVYLKHPEVLVAVHANRRKGVQKILDDYPKNEVILLDDVFQHRYVKPGLNILLTDYHKIFTKNYMLPTGNLREFRGGASRADALVITKTPSVFSPLDRKLILKDLARFNIGKIFFSYIRYGVWIPLSPIAKERNMQNAKTIILVTGIANPTPLGEYLKRLCLDLKIFKYPDHHQFTENEIGSLIEQYHETYSGSKAIITTEKDSMRLRKPELARLIENLPVYYVPIEVDFHQQDKEEFNQMVHDYMNEANTNTKTQKRKEK